MAYYEPSHLCCLKRPICIAYGSERVKKHLKFFGDFLTVARKKMIIEMCFPFVLVKQDLLRAVSLYT